MFQGKEKARAPQLLGTILSITSEYLVFCPDIIEEDLAHIGEMCQPKGTKRAKRIRRETHARQAMVSCYTSYAC